MHQLAVEQNLHGRVVVITRPAGTAAALARRIRMRGGLPVQVPGLALVGLGDAVTRAALLEALGAPLRIFTSPAAVRYASSLCALDTVETAIGVGQGTRRALRRAGIARATAPLRQDSEGVLALPALRHVAGRRIALIGAADGRGLLRQALLERGALLEEVHVYRRVQPTIRPRHLDALRRLVAGDYVLWSSADAVAQLRARLPADAWQCLCAATAVVSSERVRAVVAAAGFGRCVVARSATPADLVAAAVVAP